MNETRLLRIGGFCAMVFVGVWIIADAMYLLEVGWPQEAPTVQETAAAMQRPIYRLAFWLWPLAWLSLVVVALAGYEYLRLESPVLARIGFAFLLLNIGLWFAYHAVIMAAISVAQANPTDERQLGAFLTLIRTMGSPLFWSITLFEACWGVVLLKRSGSDRVVGWAFILGAICSLAYFVMRYIAPNRPAEIVHTLLIIFMVIGVGSLGRSLLRATNDERARWSVG